MTNQADVRFINHSCILVGNEQEKIIFDPWFSGEIFNNSWSLIRETTGLKLDKLKYVVITHEHPDHLHWPTLKMIKEKCGQDINVIVPRRKNKNIVSNLRKLGFKCAEIIPNITFKINDFFEITGYPTGHDCAYVFTAGDKVVLNQNDCYLSDEQCSLISKKHKHIDAWFMQFSLAGYYANKEDVWGLEAAKTFHKKMIKKYFNFFKPDVFIPFASFVYFCKEHNFFLNSWAIDIPEIIQEFDEIPVQILFYDDILRYKNFQKRNIENVDKWIGAFQKEKKVIKHKLVDNEDITKEAVRLINFIKSKNISAPPKVYFEFYDKEKLFEMDLSAGIARFANKDSVSKEKIAGILPSEEFWFFLKYPWGADTLNITSCFEVINRNLWKQMLIFKDSIYER